AGLAVLAFFQLTGPSVPSTPNRPISRATLPVSRPAPVRPSSASEKPELTQLTEEQRIHWERVRRQQRVGGYHVAALRRGEWGLVDTNGGRLVDHIPRLAGLYLSEDGIKADERAQRWASDPDIRVAVVVDLHSEPSPRAATWWYDDSR